MQDVMALDIGNSHCKIRLKSQDVIILVNQDIFANDFKLNLEQNYSQLIISISSVLNIDHTEELLEKLSKKLSWQQIKRITWQSNQILRTALPMQYQELSYLGSDRALRIYYLSQLEQNHPQIGIGCGTGFTVEVIHHGKLIESLILPGLELQLASLFQHTDKLPTIKPKEVEDILNNDSAKLTTNYAICAGIIQGYIALITQLIQKHQAKQIICSGAYAYLIQKFAHINIRDKIKVITHLELDILQQFVELMIKDKQGI
jgi:pantothenate kinase type III